LPKPHDRVASGGSATRSVPPRGPGADYRYLNGRSRVNSDGFQEGAKREALGALR
jgi:hypothetical protein